MVQIRPKLFEVWSVRFTFSLILLGLVAATGCDKVETLVNDAKQEVAQQTATPEPTPAPTSAPVAVPATPAAPVTPEPARPSAEQVVAEFRALAPAHVNDTVLARLAMLPDAAAQITEVDASGCQELTPNGLQHLTQLPNLQKLIVRGAQKLANADFSAFELMGKLNEFDASGLPLTGAQLAQLGKAPSLEKVSLANSTIDGAAIGQLATAEKLADLDLSQTGADDNAIANFKNLPLRRIVLNQTRVSDASLAVLGGIESLEDLSLMECQVSGPGFLKPAFANLKKLEVAKTRFGIEGLIAIKKLKKLERLGLYAAGIQFDNGNIVDPRSNVFKGFPNLQEVVLSGNGLSNVGLATLIAGHKNVQILHLNDLKGISDPGIVRLVACPKLTEIHVRDTGVSAAGANALKAKLPEVSIFGSFGKL